MQKLSTKRIAYEKLYVREKQYKNKDSGGEFNMTIRQAAKGKGVVSNQGYATYDINFINSEGLDDETQFGAESLNELAELYKDFCRENGFKTNTVTSITKIN